MEMKIVTTEAGGFGPIFGPGHLQGSNTAVDANQLNIVVCNSCYLVRFHAFKIEFSTRLPWHSYATSICIIIPKFGSAIRALL